jgi:hypothetical protein
MSERIEPNRLGRNNIIILSERSEPDFIFFSENFWVWDSFQKYATNM